MTDEQQIIEWLKDNELVKDFANFIRRPDAYTRLASGLGGWQWEDEFKQSCQLRNLPCLPIVGVLSHDAIINNLRVQCKTTCSINNADIRCKRAANKRRYTPEDFDILALRLMTKAGKRIFLIPSGELLDSKNPGFLKGRISILKYEHFENQWSVFGV